MKSIILKGVLIFILTNMLSSNVISQTIVNGGQVSGNWNLAGSPYLIQGGIIIQDGTTLSIEPGVVVNFQGSYLLRVSGRIVAEGTMQDSILFTAADTTIGWMGVRFDNTSSSNDSSKFKYCKFKYGKATGSSPNDKGGAIYCNNFSKLTISDCLISRCLATFGGAIYCVNSSPIITKNNIYDNKATYAGAGIYCKDSSHPLISYNNISYSDCGNGGGIYCYTDVSPCGPTISYNEISHNGGTTWGGGIRCIDTFSEIMHNYFHDNTAEAGGAIFSTGDESIHDNIFSNNTSIAPSNSIYGGGALFFSGNANVSNNIISNNTAAYLGGGVFCHYGNPRFTNNIISNNTALKGGGIYSASNSSIQSNPLFINNTISNNLAQTGGAIYCCGPNGFCTPTFKNSILWGNSAVTGNEVYIFDQNTTPSFYNCNVEGGPVNFGLNTNVFFLGNYSACINADPMFTSPSVGDGVAYDGVAADWSLSQNSPCLNSGDSAFNAGQSDLMGNPRVIGSNIDIGAIEYQFSNGLPDLEHQNSIVAYPNPARSGTILHFETSLVNGKITVVNQQGQIVKEVDKVNGEYFPLQIDNLADGLYFVQILTDRKIIGGVKLIVTQN